MDFTFFARLGLLAVPDFLTAQACATLRAAMLTSTHESARIGSGADAALDTAFRNVACVDVSRNVRLPLRKRLQELTPRLEKHFGVTLHDFESLIPPVLRGELLQATSRRQ